MRCSFLETWKESSVIRNKYKTGFSVFSVLCRRNQSNPKIMVCRIQIQNLSDLWHKIVHIVFLQNLARFFLGLVLGRIWRCIRIRNDFKKGWLTIIHSESTTSIELAGIVHSKGAEVYLSAGTGSKLSTYGTVPGWGVHLCSREWTGSWYSISIGSGLNIIGRRTAVEILHSMYVMKLHIACFFSSLKVEKLDHVSNRRQEKFRILPQRIR
jgi:hypothetical protein